MHIPSRAVPSSSCNDRGGARDNILRETTTTFTSPNEQPRLSLSGYQPVFPELPESTASSSPISTSSSSAEDPGELPAVLVPTSPDSPGLNMGEIIGLTLGIIIFILLLVVFMDMILLNSRVTNLFKRKSLLNGPKPLASVNPKHFSFYRDKKRFSRMTNLRNPLPSTPILFYDQKIQPSRCLSIDSGSRYSRSTRGWRGATFEEDGGSDWSSSYYSVFEEEDMREQVLNYGGRIRPGMGVQRRHSAGSLAKTELNLYDGKEYSGLMISPQVQWNNKAVRDRFRRPSMIVMGLKTQKPSWSHSVLELRAGDRRDRRSSAGLSLSEIEMYRRFWRHPLSGKRGAEFHRIGYF